MNKYILIVCLTYLTFITNSAIAEDKFKKIIEADYDKISLSKALKSFRKETKISMVLDPSLNLETSINIIVDKAPADKVLEWIKEQSDMEYQYDNDVLILMSKQEMSRRQTKEFLKNCITQDYYVGDLLGTLNDFYAPRMQLAQADATGARIEVVEPKEDPMSYDELHEFIKVSVNPDSWDNGEIITLHNKLIIKTSKENQEKINELLTKLRTSQSILVQTTLKFYSINKEELDQINQHLDKLVLNETGEDLVKKFSLVDFVQGAGYSTQQISFANIIDQAYVRDFTSVAQTNVCLQNPEIGYLKSGTSISVRSTASNDRKSVRVALRFDRAKYESMNNLVISENISGSNNKNSGPQQIQLQLPKLKYSTSRSTIRIPEGKWYLKTLGAEDKKFNIVLIKCNVIQK